MPRSPRLSWPYPGEDQDPWFVSFEDFVAAQDNSVFAAMEDRNIFLQGGGSVAFDAGSDLLSWDAPIEINSPITGFRHVIPAGSLTLPDLSMAYVLLSRSLTDNTTLSIAAAASMPFGAVAETFFGLCLRRGSRLYFRTGGVLQDGEDRPLIEDGGGGGSGIGAPGEKLRSDIVIALKHSDSSGVSTAVGHIAFHPGDYAITGTTLSVVFSVLGYVTSSGVQGTVELFDLTASSSVDVITFTDSNLSPTAKVSTELSLPTANHVYEVRIRRTGGTGSLFLSWAGIRVDRMF